jgi:hypothetical protein
VVALQRAAERIGIKAIESVVAEMHERAAAAARNTSAEFAREEEALAAEAVHETAEAATVARKSALARVVTETSPTKRGFFTKLLT